MAEFDLGCFSMSLSVADLEKSLAFYEALGFEVIGGQDEWRILSNGPTKIGLFHGVFEGHMLTFNPGLAQEWSDDDEVTSHAGPEGDERMPGQLDEFTDVRDIEQRLLAAGMELSRRTETPEGADHITLVDPDGNQILIDQFF